jgi:hypothetical protein
VPLPQHGERLAAQGRIANAVGIAESETQPVDTVVEHRRSSFETQGPAELHVRHQQEFERATERTKGFEPRQISTMDCKASHPASSHILKL